ncbi:TetR/AcrR family transcriptional regulator [Salipiger sp. P9]|uniref:TetR/AcrR family transcriptional regulator n=1 Tax=Salipiger pentaromativorans TaxID=2943193 RepID=UPI0021583302|nr:TetR/AcrR family transcriptional regulator [Salipiger pentaromativorans]MCR8547891.1 TetR/AcrR family transcriptional regulator [Salipiger pentaromativorans]
MTPDSQPDRPDAPLYSYPAILVAEARQGSKGARTRARIAAAACALLDETAPQDLTIAAICQRAEVSQGTFYIYFPDRIVLIQDLLLGFVAVIQRAMRAAGHSQPDDTIRAATRAYCALFRRNRGLMRCLVHHLDSFPEAREAFHRLNRDWLETVVASVERRRLRSGAGPAVPHDELMRRAYALGGMVDQYLSGLLLSRDPALMAISEDADAVLNTLTLIWKRGMEL